MKKRGSLVFALCAMAGAMTLACSDDSGNSAPKTTAELAVNPTIMTLSVGEIQNIDVSYGSKMDLVITSEKADCVQINDDTKAEVTTSGEGKVTVKAKAVGASCTSIVTVADKDDSNVFKNVNVTVLAAGEENGDLTLTPDTLELEAGGSDTAVAHYKMVPSGTPGASETLKLESSNPACANVESSVVTDANGNANIKVTAADNISDECNAMISVTPPKGTAKSISVKVTKDDDPGPIVTGGSLTFDPTSLNIPFTGDKKGNIEVLYKDGNGDGVANANVKFDYDVSCVSISGNGIKKVKTDSNGKINLELVAQKDGCTTTLTAHSGDLDASAEISVGSKEEFSFTLETGIDAKYFDKIGYVKVGTSDQTCAALTGTEAGLQAGAEAAADEEAQLNGASPILSTYEMTDITVDQKSVLAIGKASPTSGTKAYGCTDISVADDGQTVHVELVPVKTQITGTYDIVSNFDISSAFTKDAHASMVYVEEMNAGDWINFVVKLFDKPIDTLIDFIWANSISRLAMIKNDAGEQVIPEWLTNVILGETGQALVKDTLRPMLEKYLEQYGWYTTITTISPDIKDLVTNMQLNGLMTVSEADLAGDKVTKANQVYSFLQYQWSLKTGAKCDDKAYHKKDTCRVNMNLKDSKYLDATITGDWTGALSFDDVKGDLLTIDEHKLEFKWATILYAAVFGEILPLALNYKDAESIKKGLYIKGFLEKVLFDTIVKVYNEGRSEYNTKHSCTCDSKGICSSSTDEACHSVLQQTQSCEKFIEALVYMIYGKASDYASVIGVIASYACGDQGIGQLEKLVNTSLGKVEAGKFNIKSKDACTLYDEGEVEYKHLGAMDELVHSAYDVFKTGSKIESQRCTWDFALTDNYTLYGLFHAYRQ